MLRVVIAGGAGFIGSHLCECFLNQNDSVVCVDNYLTGTPQNILHLQSNPKFELIVQDITKPLSIDGEVDTVLNFASPASPPHYLEHPIETLMVDNSIFVNDLVLIFIIMLYLPFSQMFQDSIR